MSEKSVCWGLIPQLEERHSIRTSLLLHRKYAVRYLPHCGDLFAAIKRKKSFRPLWIAEGRNSSTRLSSPLFGGIAITFILSSANVVISSGSSEVTPLTNTKENNNVTWRNRVLWMENCMFNLKVRPSILCYQGKWAWKMLKFMLLYSFCHLPAKKYVHVRFSKHFPSAYRLSYVIYLQMWWVWWNCFEAWLILTSVFQSYCESASCYVYSAV